MINLVQVLTHGDETPGIDAQFSYCMSLEL